MLRLLLDEHISPAVAEQLRRHNPQVVIVSLQEWENGRHLQASDPTLLSAAEQQLTLVTCDQRTIIPLLKEWGEQGRSHGGVVLIDAQTVMPNDIGGLVRALAGLWQSLGQVEWADRVVYLTAQQAEG